MNEQPMPTEGRQDVPPVVLERFTADLQARDRKGIETYGRRLQTWNGRDAGQDAWEELIDLAQYLTQMRLERGDLVDQIERLTAENPTCVGHIPTPIVGTGQVCERCRQPYPCEVRRMWILKAQAEAERDAALMALASAQAALREADAALVTVVNARPPEDERRPFSIQVHRAIEACRANGTKLPPDPDQRDEAIRQLSAGRPSPKPGGER